MRKLITAATPSEAVALIGINAGDDWTNVQTGNDDDPNMRFFSGSEERML